MKAIKLETETALIIFYVSYFIWLTLLVFFSSDHMFLNYLSSGVVLFYFVFLYDKGDFMLFIITMVLFFLFTLVGFKDFMFDLHLDKVFALHYWLPLAWGTTVVALRKIYTIIASRDHY